jgi:hypothetical protein
MTYSTGTMKQPVTLTAASFISAALFPVHLAHDFIYGLDSMGRYETFTYLGIMLVLLYGTLELSGRRAGYIVMLLGGIFAMGMPVLHTVGGPRAATHGFWFVWTLLAMGASGVLAFVLAARELWVSARRVKS